MNACHTAIWVWCIHFAIVMFALMLSEMRLMTMKVRQIVMPVVPTRVWPIWRVVVLVSVVVIDPLRVLVAAT